MQIILQHPKTTTQKAMHSFLGMAGFCHQLIPAYAPLAWPLYDLTLHDTPFPNPFLGPLQLSFLFLT